MERRVKSEWFRFDRPIGEPDVKWYNEPYDIERVVNSEGTTIWFGRETNWKKEKGGEWTKLITNENAKPLDKYLPEIVYGEDRNIFVKCDIPIYEKLYLESESKIPYLGDVMNMNSVDLDVNHTFWSDALSTIDKNKLIELCEQFNIPTKGKDRYRLASNLSKRINLNNGMKILVGFE